MAVRTYLGDGVYAEHENGLIWIYTSNGIVESPRIALDDEVIEQLLIFRKKMADRLSEVSERG